MSSTRRSTLPLLPNVSPMPARRKANERTTTKVPRPTVVSRRSAPPGHTVDIHEPDPTRPLANLTERVARLSDFPSESNLELLGPGELAVGLDMWALRRDKVLRLLNPRAARAARSLADRARSLPWSQQHWTIANQNEWREIRVAALRLLTPGSG